jgi:hypothetical protein
MTQAKCIIAKFGGINRMARLLDHKNASTVQGWAERGVIPSRHQQAIWDAAQREGIPLEPSDFLLIEGIKEAAS